MLEDNCGKLLVYVSSAETRKGRLKAVSLAVEKTAKRLNLGVEVVPLKGANAPIYIYYKDGINEPIPLYCDKESENTTEKVCTALRSMMFVLSFHPKYSALKKIRREIIRFS
ncbi:MAG: hypothetical protein QXK18_07015 [Candidatus Bathyarchaeia archaeon]